MRGQQLSLLLGNTENWENFQQSAPFISIGTLEAGGRFNLRGCCLQFDLTKITYISSVRTNAQTNVLPFEGTNAQTNVRRFEQKSGRTNKIVGTSG